MPLLPLITKYHASRFTDYHAFDTLSYRHYAIITCLIPERRYGASRLFYHYATPRLRHITLITCSRRRVIHCFIATHNAISLRFRYAQLSPPLAPMLITLERAYMPYEHICHALLCCHYATAKMRNMRAAYAMMPSLMYTPPDLCTRAMEVPPGYVMTRHTPFSRRYDSWRDASHYYCFAYVMGLFETAPRWR